MTLIPHGRRLAKVRQTDILLQLTPKWEDSREKWPRVNRDSQKVSFVMSGNTPYKGHFTTGGEELSIVFSYFEGVVFEFPILCTY
jgi:hypothetical protein